MIRVDEIRTERLLLRRWRDEDRAPFAAINADPEVTALLSGPLDAAGSDALIGRIEDGFERRGFGLWAVEVVGAAPLVGFTGMSVPRFETHFTPCVEIGWRLAAAHWGHGYATEAARAVLTHAWDAVALDEVVSFTTAGNERSRAVMARLGMRRDPADDFDHPALPPGHVLRRHVLYRIARPADRPR